MGVSSLKSTGNTKKYRALGCLGEETIPDYFHRIAQKYGDATALVGKSRFTYHQLWQKIDFIASGLQTNGVETGEPIVMHLQNDDVFIITFLAVLCIGATPVLALPGHREFELNYFIQLTGSKSLIISQYQGEDDCSSLIDKLIDRNSSLENIFVDGDHPAAHSIQSLSRKTSSQFRRVTRGADDIAFFLLSGGTTGLPKLIPRRHAEYIYNCNLAAKNADITQQSSYLAVLTMAHNFALGCPGVLGTLFSGGIVYITPNTSPDENFVLIQKYHISHCALVPPLAALWANARVARDENLSSLQVIQVGGSRVAPQLAAQFVEMFPGCLQQSYGMGEGLLSQTNNQDSLESILNTQGRPLSPFDEVRVIDSEGNEILHRPARGELLVRGPYTISGYYQAESHNAKVFTQDGFFCTGDVVTINKDDTLVVEGRMDDVINRGGDKISPDEVEDHLLAHPKVKDAAVVALFDELMGHRVCAALLVNGKLRLPEVKSFLRGRGIADYKLPDKVMILDTFPKTGFGKLDRKSIKKMANENRG